MKADNEANEMENRSEILKEHVGNGKNNQLV